LRPPDGILGHCLSLVTRVVAVVAFGTGGGVEVGCVAVTAGGVLMVETVAVAAAGMGEVEIGRGPGTGVVALVAAHAPEQPSMEGGFAMTGGTGCWQGGKYAAGMASGAGQPGVRAGERETGDVMVKGGGSPA